MIMVRRRYATHILRFIPLFLFLAAALISQDSSITLDVDIAPTVELSRIFELAGLKEIPVSGRLSGKIKVQGRPDNLNLTGRMHGDNVTIDGYAHTKIDIEFRASKQAGRVLVRSFDIKSSAGLISGSCDLYLDAKNEVSSINATLQNFNLLPLSKKMNPTVALASQADGTVSLQWKGSFDRDRLSGDARLRLRASRSTPAEDIIPATGWVDLKIRSGSISIGISELNALGGVMDGRIALSRSDAIAGNIDGSFPNLENFASQLSGFLGKKEITPVRLAGPVEFKTILAGSLAQPELNASIASTHLQIDKWTDVGLSLDARLSHSQLALTGQITPATGANISLKGSIGLDGKVPTMNLDLQADRLPVAVLLPLIGKTMPADGVLSASLLLGGTFENPTVVGSIQGRQLRIYQEPMGSLDADLRLSGGQIQIPQIRLMKAPGQADGGSIEAQGAYNLDSHEFTFRSAGKNLFFDRLEIPNYPFRGAVNFTAEGSGTTDLPVINAELSSTGVEIRGVHPGLLAATASLKNKVFTVDARLTRFGLNANVRIGIEKPYPINVQANASQFDLALLGVKKVAGTLDLELTGAGNLDNPLQGEASASIQNVSARFGEVAIGTRGPVQLAYRDGLVKIPAGAIITSGNSTLQLAGSFPVIKESPAGELSLQIQGDVSDFSKLAGVPSGMVIQGRADLDWTISGTLENPGVVGSFALAKGFLRYPGIPEPFSDIHIQAKLGNGAVALQQATARWGMGNIRLAGEAPLAMLAQKLPLRLFRSQNKRPASFDLVATGLELKSTGKLPEEINGLISLKVSGSAGSFNPQSVTADIQFDELKLDLGKVTIRQQEPSHLLVLDGRVSIQKFALVGPETNLLISGSSGFTENTKFDLQLQGTTDAGLLGAFTNDVKLAGPVQLLAAISGKTNAPHLSGFVEIKDGQAGMRSPAATLDSLNARLNFMDNRITIASFRGVLNGGSMTAEGSAELKSGALKSLNLSARLRDVFLEFPAGLRSFFTADLTAQSINDSVIVAGKARVLDSSYRRPFEIGGGLTKIFQSQPQADLEKARSPLLSRMRFNVAIASSVPLVVKNNVADLEATGDLRLVGTYYVPSIVGRVNLEEGGRLFLNQRTYYVRQGQISLDNQMKVEPDLNIQAETTVSGYDITMQINGVPERLTTELSSDPPLSHAEIVSMLLTGRPLQQYATGREYQMAQASQAISLLAGQAGEGVASGARNVLGITTIRLEPSFIASEINPGARLTLGQDINRNFRVGYSMNLINGGEQVWLAEYDVTKRFTTQVTKQEDNSYRLGFTHDLRFGVAPNEASGARIVQRPKIGNVTLQGGPLFSEKILREKFNLKAGDRYEFPKVEKSLDRIKKSYYEQNKLEARVRLERERMKGIVNLTVKVEPGPDVDFTYEGAEVSRKTRERIRKIWEEGVFDTTRIDESATAIRSFFIEEGYLQASVTCETELRTGVKKVQFRINPGERYSGVSLEFFQTSASRQEELRKVLKSAGLLLDVYLEPKKVTDYLQDYYRKRGYLSVAISPPQMQLDPINHTGKVVIPVQEGERYKIGELSFAGNKAFDYFQLWSLIPISSGSIYSPDSVQESMDVLEQFYRDHGFNEVGMLYHVDRLPQKAHANVTFRIKENKQSIIRDIRIEGNRLISAGMVKKTLTFDTGEALDFSKMGVTRKNLYETGLYSLVDFETEDLDGPDSGDKKSVRVKIQLRELSAYRLNYGGYFDTERGPGGIADFTRRSPFGQAAVTGLRLRYDSELQQARLYYSQPRIKNFRLKTDAIFLAQREDRGEAFKARRIGMSLIQQRNLPGKFVLDYGYRYDHVHWTGNPEDPTLFISDTPVARATGTLWRDTRDNILNATSGEFMSNSFEYGPSWLGSQIGFYKYFGQYFRYVGLDGFLFRPNKNEKGKSSTPKLVYAGAIRVGVTNAFDRKSSIISPELFFAGGGTTMRGFEQDKLGPLRLNVNGKPVPAGGEGLFLLNNELRFPIYDFLKGAGFVDIGNVYRNVSDFSFKDLRKSAGFGLRVDVHYLLLRFDYGFKLDRRPGESGSEFFFSLGQAF